MTTLGDWLAAAADKTENHHLPKKFRHGPLQADHLWTSAKAIMDGPLARTMTALGWQMAATADQTKKPSSSKKIRHGPLQADHQKPNRRHTVGHRQKHRRTPCF
jgi:hypothetical protein